MQVAFLQLGNVVVKSHTTVDDHGGTFLEAGVLGGAIKHGGQRLAILDVAGEYLVGDRKPITIDHQSQDHLFAVGSLITRMTTFGLGIMRT
jgi:hypothetical protein